MTQWFACPFLGREVELTDERESHMRSRHPELSDVLSSCIGATLSDPDEVRQSSRVRASHVFVRWFDTILSGKHIAVVVITDSHPVRDWVVTTYAARKLGEGSVVWRRG